MKKRQVVLGVVVMLIMLTTRVYATIGSGKLAVEYNAPNDFCSGEEFFATISLKNLETEVGIKSIEGYIDVDQEILEPLTVENIVTDSDGNVKVNDNNLLPVYDVNNITGSSDIGIIVNPSPVSGKGQYRVVINFDKPISDDTDIFTLKLKIKDGVTVGTHSSAITYKLFTIFENNAKDKLEFDTLNYNLELVEKNTTEDKTDDNTDNKNEDETDDKTDNKNEDKTDDKTDNKNEDKTDDNTDTKNENKTDNKIDTKNENKTNDNTDNKIANKTSNNQTSNKIPVNANAVPDGTVAPSNLPKTGYRGLLIPIIAMIILGLVFYKKYSKYNNYHE